MKVYVYKYRYDDPKDEFAYTKDKTDVYENRDDAEARLKKDVEDFAGHPLETFFGDEDDEIVEADAPAKEEEYVEKHYITFYDSDNDRRHYWSVEEKESINLGRVPRP